MTQNQTVDAPSYIMLKAPDITVGYLGGTRAPDN